MKKIFTKWYTPVVLLLIGLVIGLNVPVSHLQEAVAATFMAAFGIGLGMQAWEQYQTGKVGIHWTLNTLTFFAMILRAIYMLRTGQEMLSIPDIFGVCILGIMQLQSAGFLLKKQVK